MQKYKSAGNRGLFDKQENLSKLSVKGNPLERLSKVIDFEMFRDLLESRLLNVNKKSNAGCKPYDVLMMFKLIILQRYYGLGDEQIEYQILDRMSFKHFLGLESGDKVPDEKTVWLFRENLTKTGLAEDLFEMFHTCLEQKGMILNEGKMVDASFTIAPRQRNTREENQMIKSGKGDELWNDHPHKKRHKDIDARWTKKNGETFYGYKDHVKVDAKSKFIDKYTVTDASVDDSQPLEALLEQEKDRNQDFHADSAYTGKEQDKVIARNRMNNKVHEKGYRNKSLTEEQKASNREKSKVRARVEHVFGFMEQSMKGLYLRSVGMFRAKAIIGLINLTYNLFRYEQVVRLNLIKVKH
jgi:Transposase and inactivated derivatives, IS5 family